MVGDVRARLQHAPRIRRDYCISRAARQERTHAQHITVRREGLRDPSDAISVTGNSLKYHLQLR